MSISKTQIFNIALNILGVSTPLENPNSSDSRAILLNNYYELAKNCVLKDFDWNFASTYRILALSEERSVLNKYLYCYDYPNDCISARELFDSTAEFSLPFEIASVKSCPKVILTNAKNAILRYTRRIDKEIYFSCEFSMALSYYLASLTSNVIVGSLQKGELAFEKYKEILSRAKLLNAVEGADTVYDDKTYLDGRN